MAMSRDEMKAPAGKFRVIWVDTFDHSDGLLIDVDDREHAIIIAKQQGEQMFKTHAYDDQGDHIGEGGTF